MASASYDDVKTRRSLLSLTMISAVMVAMAGCATDVDDPEENIDESEAALTPLTPEKVDAISQTPWTTLGYGVSYKAIDSATNEDNALLVYGGYTAQDVYVQRWADELVRTKTSMGIAHLYAIRGPNQAGYANEEIMNSKLAAHLGAGGANGVAAKATSILVVAHSSGTYVADELLSMLRQGASGPAATTLGKVTLFNLDGGGVSSSSLVAAMKNTYFVYAYDPGIGRYSHNASGMKSLGDEYDAHGGAIKVNAQGSGCSKSASGGLWCLHDTLITTRPHNPAMYDLRNDYTDFSSTPSRKVVTSYLDVLDSQ